VRQREPDKRLWSRSEPSQWQTGIPGIFEGLADEAKEG